MLELYHAIPIPMVILSEDASIHHVNDAVLNHLNMRNSEILQQPNHTLFHPSHLDSLDCPICYAIDEKKSMKNFAYKDKIKQTVTEYSIDFIEIDTKPYTVQVCLDVTETYERIEKIKNLKNHMQMSMTGYDAGTWEWNLVDDSGYFSPEWKEMLGYARDEQMPSNLSTWSSRVHPGEIEVLISDVASTLAEKAKKIESIHRLKHKNGQWLWILGRGVIEYDANNNPLRMIGIHTNITNQKLLQIKSEERGKILEGSLNEIYIFDADTLRFMYINKGAHNNIGYTYDEIVRLTPIDIKPDITKERFLDILKPIVQESKENIFFSTLHQRKDGSKYDVDVYLQSTVYEGRAAYVAIILDVSKRKRVEEELLKQKNMFHHQAHHHTLTGLPNRVLFTDRLEQSIIKAQRHQIGFALFFLDLDKFKSINDAYGHSVGDSVLKEVAIRLEKVIRNEDTAAHISGDEFTIIMEDLRRPEDAAILAKKIIKALEKPMHIDEHELSTSASIGISLYPQNTEDAQTLLKYADAAMYTAKNEGRNTFKYYKPHMTLEYSI